MKRVGQRRPYRSQGDVEFALGLERVKFSVGNLCTPFLGIGNHRILAVAV